MSPLRPRIRPIRLTALCLALAAAPVAAQEAATPDGGELLRLTHSHLLDSPLATDSSVVGRLTRAEAGALFVRVGDAEIWVPRDAELRVEHLGPVTEMRSHARLGAFLGAVAGGLLAFVTFEPEYGPVCDLEDLAAGLALSLSGARHTCPTKQTNDPPLFAGLAVGGALGAGIGWSMRTEREVEGWVEVDPATLGIALGGTLRVPQ